MESPPIAPPSPTPSRPVPEGFLRIISNDGFEFIVEEKYALVSGVIRTMLEVDFKETHTREIHFPEEGAVIEKAIQYMYHKPRQDSLKFCAKENKSQSRVVHEPFEFPQAINVKLLLFASFLDM